MIPAWQKHPKWIYLSLASYCFDCEIRKSQGESHCHSPQPPPPPPTHTHTHTHTKHYLPVWNELMPENSDFSCAASSSVLFDPLNLIKNIKQIAVMNILKLI